jgi:hypothetical protein
VGLAIKNKNGSKNEHTFKLDWDVYLIFELGYYKLDPNLRLNH